MTIDLLEGDGGDMSSRELAPNTCRGDAPDGATTAPVLVFGSNLAGRHGKGAALWARQHRGAIYGQGEGLQGNSYAIPTKFADLKVMPARVINEYARNFLRFARSRPDLTFQLTPIGCGLAGYKHAEIAPMFAGAPPNVILPEEFEAVLAAARERSEHSSPPSSERD